jgi:hypothetical protein
VVRPVAPKEKKRMREQRDATCPDITAKIFLFAFHPNHFISLAVSFPKEGRLAIVTDVGNEMQWTRAALLTSARSFADGEVVWS